MVSIVFLTKNGGELFEKSLISIFSQEVDFEFEVIAVDSGSTDGTLAVIDKYPVRLFAIPPEEFNFGLTRNYSFGLAKGEIIIVISQDAVPANSSWLRNMVSPFEDQSIAVVQGVDILPQDEDLFFWERKGLFYFTRDCKKWLKNNNGIGLSFTCCAIRRNVWESAPLGKIEMNEDKVFQKNLVGSNFKIIVQHEATFFHFHTYDMKALMNRCENEGLGWKQAGQKYTFFEMILDIFCPLVVKTWLKALLRLEFESSAAFLFPIIRPMFLYKGNQFTKKFVK